ncbi:TPA: DUF4194 domain-containing protein [Pseudomonas aeruginosa]
MEPMALDDGMDDEQSLMIAAVQVDERRTPQRVREAVQEMLKYGLLEESHKPNLYRSALSNVEVVDRILEPLDLAMGVDEVRGLVFVTVRQGEVSEQDDWSHPLVRRQRLNLEQSLLIAILRQHFIAYEQESGTGASQALVAVDELIPQLQVYLGELGSEAKERNRIITLLDQLKGHGLVSALDAHDRVIIRPIITHLANPENLQALVVWLREQVEGATTPAAAAEEDEA